MSVPREPSALRKALLRVGSTHVGLALIAAIAFYLSLASTAPVWLAGRLGIGLFHPEDPVELFRCWVFVPLCIALCVNLAVATALRVPLRWPSLGAWCSHAGLLVLAGGAGWYTLRSVSGDSATVRMRGGWSPIRHVYVKRSFAAYLTAADANAPDPVQTPLRGLLPRGKPRELDAPLAGAPAGAEVRASGFFPLARVIERWQDVSPNRIPAVQFHLADGDEAGTLVLSPSLPDHRQFGGRGYVMVYHDGLDPRALAKVISPADPNRGPGMPHELALFLTGPHIEPTLAVVRPDGTRWHGKLQAGEALEVPLAGRTVRVQPVAFFRHAARIYELAPGPGEPHGHGLAYPPGPALRVDARAGEWRRTTYVPFASYEHLAPPQLLDLPGDRAIWLSFSRPRLALPATLQVRTAEYQTYPASGIPKDYRCQVEVASGGTRRLETLSLNHPVQVGCYQFSQGSWREDPHEPTQIVLLAATRPGVPAVWLGCVLVCLGLPIAFYVKPLLLSAGRSRA